MVGESNVTQSINHQRHSSDIQRDQMEGENSVTRSMIDELHSSDIQRDQMDGERGVIEVSLKNFILRISNEMKWHVKVV